VNALRLETCFEVRPEYAREEAASCLIRLVIIGGR